MFSLPCKDKTKELQRRKEIKRTLWSSPLWISSYKAVELILKFIS